MKFTIERASNCDLNQLLIHHPFALPILQKHSLTTGKKLVSNFFSCCLCIPSNISLLILKKDKLGIPPPQLEYAQQGMFVLSYSEPQPGESDYKIPLLCTKDKNLAQALLRELEHIYLTSTPMTDLVSDITLKELDAQARIWHQLFNLSSISRGTQQIELDKNLIISAGKDISKFIKKNLQPPLNVKSLTTAPQNPAAAKL